MKDQTRSKNIADGEQISNTLSSGTDIIEKKRAEATLQDSEERFRKVFEEGPLGIVLLGLDAGIQHCNRCFCKMLAYSEEEIIALGLVGITHADDWQKDFEVGSRLLNGEIPNYTIEKRYVRKGGVVFWGQLTVSMMHDAAGKPTAVIGMVQDIDERKRAEEALRESEERYRMLAETTTDAIGIHDRNGTLLYGNRAGAVVFGLDPSKAVGMTQHQLLPVEVAEKHMKAIATVFQTEELLETKDEAYLHGSDEKWLNTRLIPLRNEHGEVTSVMSVSRDITKRKRAEEALRESEERYRTLAESTTDIIAIHDRNGTLLYGNPAGAAYCGIESSSTVGMTQQELFPPEMVRKHTELIAKVFQTGELFETDGAYSHGSGEIWFNTRLIPLRDEYGQVTSVMSVSRNVTKRKQAEEALKKAHDELERRVEKRTAELTNTNEQLRQSHNELRAIYDGMVDGLLVTDIETQRFMRANAAICRMLGYSETELLSLSVSDIHPAEALPNILDYFPSAADSPATPPGEIPFLRRDGSMFYAEAIGKYLSYNGNPCSMGIFRDITERRQAKAVLQQNRDELQAIYDGMIDGLLLADIETMQFVRTNSSMCRMLGYSEEQLLSMSVSDIHPPEELASVSEDFRAFAEGRIVVFDDLLFARRDGSVFCAQATGRAIVYNGRPCVIGFFRDNTERKRAEEAIRQSEEKHRGLLEACPDAVVMVDLNGRILFASRQTYELVGLSDQEELIGQSVFDYVIEGDRRRLVENIPRLVQSGVRRNIEYTVLRQDGTTVPTEISSALNRDATGQPFAIMVVIRDITERKQAQDALQREYRTLKHLLQSSDHERQTIAYEIHDGLAQYLAAAIMQFDVYKGHQEKRPNEATKAYDAAITLLCQGHSEARRLIAGIRHPVLDEAGVVEAVAHLINEQNRDKGPKIEFRSLVDFSRLVPLLENAIYRIIQEGMTNACKYSQSERVRIILFQQKDRLRIEIRDWGIGFDTKNVKEGSYGLTGIRERARLLGGKYRLQSKVGKGTRIVVELHLMEREE